MLPHKLERLLYRILSGKTILNSSRLVIHSPSLDLLYESEEYYSEYFDKNGVLTREEIRNFLLNNQIISQKDLDYLKVFEKTIQNLQKELYYNFKDPLRSDAIRKLIKEARNKQDLILNDLGKYESYSKESLASYAKSIFIILNTTYKDDKKFDFSTNSPVSILSELNEKRISNSDIREIAKGSSWTNTWFGLKGSTIFQNIPTTEQQLLLMWSKVYDNIRESTECPNEDVINDNDAIDGWIVHQKEEILKEKVKQESKKIFNSKINNADEVFILARSKEDVDRIQSQNTGHAKRIQQERIKQIYEQGTVNHHNLLDVRRDIQNEYHKMGMEHAHGKKN
jgi:hypothetical protein